MLCVAGLGLALHGLIGYRVVAFMLLVTVSILAMFLDIIPVILAAFIGALSWDFLFIPPRYGVTELVDDKVIKVTINVGFRVQPRSELFFKKIVNELVANKELNLHIRPDGSTKYNAEPDFKFVIIEKFLSVENEFTLREGLLLNGYFTLKYFGQSDEKAFGLDKSDVVEEHVPLVYHRVQQIDLVRREYQNPDPHR